MICDFLRESGRLFENQSTLTLLISEENIFHTKMLLKDFDLNTYLFHVEADELEKTQRENIEKSLKQEMYEIFYGRNIQEKLPIMLASARKF